MFHKVKSVQALPEKKLCVQFGEGQTKIYDVKALYEKWPVFQQLDDESLFNCVKVDSGGYGISWNDEIDLSCDELFYHGEIIETPFDNLMAFNDATTIWGLNESTLRKAISYGKLVNGIDVCKFGKQWIITMSAMLREYGEPKKEVCR